MNLRARPSHRLRRAGANAAVAALARASGLIVLIVSVPLTLPHLGNERFGLWTTVSSVLAAAGILDFGIGSGLISVVAQADGRDDEASIQAAFSDALAMLTAVAVGLGVVLALSLWVVPWADVLGARSPLARREAAQAIAALGICVVLTLPLSALQRLQMGLQEGYRRSAWDVAGSALAVAGIAVVVIAGGGVPWLVAAFAGGPVLAAAVNTAAFLHTRTSLRPALARVSAAGVRRLIRLGGLFFVLQVAMTVAFTSDNVVIAQILGSQAVTQYAVPWRLFNLIAVGGTLVTAPLWPAYGEALARGEREWVSRTFRRSVVGVTVLCAIAATGLVIVADPLIRTWAGSHVHPPPSLLIGLAIWSIMFPLGGAVSVLLNALHVIRLQVVAAVAMATVNLALSIVLTHRYGIVGVVYGSVASFGVLVLIPYAVAIPRLLRGLTVDGA